MTTPDACSYSGPIFLNMINTIKDQKKNKVYITMSISPNIKSMKGIDFTTAINP